MTQEYIQQLADTLVGTCMTLPEAARSLWGDDFDEDREMDTPDYEALDELVLQCSSCGWWEFPCDTVEHECEIYCDDCNPEDYEE